VGELLLFWAIPSQIGWFSNGGQETALEFKLPSPYALRQEKDWIEVPVTVECEHSALCEIAKGKIQISRLSHGWRGSLKSASGKFMVTINDGRKIEGNFTARYVNSSKKVICE
jgi:hypothetical protein